MSTAADKLGTQPLDVAAVREDFPILHQSVQGKPLAYLDNAATSQKPRQVIEAVDHYYRMDNANIHRGVHTLAERATQAYEAARERMTRFINAASEEEVIFLRGTTEAINLVAQSWARPRLEPGDEILITELDHHSNIVPWQLVCEQTGAKIRAVSVKENGELDLDSFEEAIARRPRLFAVGHVSNALGTINPIKHLVERAHAHGVPVLVDGAQATPHMAVDVQALGCDFYAFSGHKMFGPTGIGVLWARRELLTEMPPWQGGGEMIKMVRLDRSIWNDLPHKFEAGTPNIAGAIGLAAAADYIESLGIDAIGAWENELLRYATVALEAIPGVRIIGTSEKKSSVISFVVDNVHPHDLGTILDSDGVAIRAGHHCAMPLMEKLDLVATARASMAFYNTQEEIDALAGAIRKAQEVLG
ncbi:cysteine desulfurase/selenocysteine lyase [Natronospira proteinivora]|uniref:Cysteine desulfurase n=1 Tax=Natronospira proteinivora TaxID=1807133 RepID=A0ABT1G636_9GAMM|nr:cysteine desulfurase [Natronospira proteinivora]MCP1726761.1 cysteine desulfurase/selenocysteine lyase [Natronospira proteinivora]